MKTKTEKMDRAMQRLTVWRTIGWTVAFGAMLVASQVKDGPGQNLIYGIAGLGFLLFIITTVWVMRNKVQIKANPLLNEAMNNEMYRQNGYKSYFYGFMVMLAAQLILLYMAIFLHPLSVPLVVGVSLLCGGLAVYVSYLLMNRG